MSLRRHGKAPSRRSSVSWLWSCRSNRRRSSRRTHFCWRFWGIKPGRRLDCIGAEPKRLAPCGPVNDVHPDCGSYRSGKDDGDGPPGVPKRRRGRRTGVHDFRIKRLTPKFCVSLGRRTQAHSRSFVFSARTALLTGIAHRSGKFAFCGFRTALLIGGPHRLWCVL